MYKNKTYNILLLMSFGLFSLIVYGAVNNLKSDAIQWLNPVKELTADSNYELKFQISGYENPILFIHYSSGKTLLKPEIKDKEYIFKLPEYIGKKAGTISLKIISNKEVVFKERLDILPSDSEKNSLESYLGPPSTWVGPGNFVTFVTIPLDQYDNVLSEGTPLQIKENINKNILSNTIPTKDFISWKRINAPTKSGKIFVSSQYKNKTTKEYEAEIYPHVGQKFIINYERLHDYADGNQLTTLFTSIIKDKYGNIVSNGTKINFELIDENNQILKVFGSTKDGVAKAQWLHPEKSKSYKVQANISGLAVSNAINLSYKTWTLDIDYLFGDKNRSLSIGPLKSYMNQFMPNGTKVNLKIFSNQKLVKEQIENSINGVVNFQFKPHLFKNGSYDFEIETMGKILAIKDINLK